MGLWKGMSDSKSMFSFESLKFLKKDFITIVYKTNGSSFVFEASSHFQFLDDSEVIPSMINFS